MGVVLLERLAACIGLAHVVEGRTGTAERIPVCRIQRKSAPDRMLFEDLPELEQLQNVGRGPHCHPEPSTRQMLDQALLREQPQRLPHRRPADTEPGAQRFLHYARPRLERTAEHLGADLASGHLDETQRQRSLVRR